MKLNSILIFLAMLSACQQKPEVLDTQKKPVILEPEVVIDSEFDGNTNLGTEKLRISTDQYFLMLKQIFEISRDQALNGKTESQKKLGLKLMSRVVKATNLFYQDSELVTRVPIAESPYLRKAIQSFEPDIKTSVEEGISMLETNLNILLQESKNLSVYDAAGNPTIVLGNVVPEVRFRLNVLQSALKKRNLDPRVEKELKAALKDQVEPLLIQIENRIQNILAQTTLTGSLNEVKLLVQEQEIELTPELNSTINEASDLGLRIDQMTTGQNALTLVVMFWRQLSPEDRERIIKPVSAELYDKLNGAKPRKLECYAEEKGCEGLISTIEKKVIRKKLAEYGIEKLRVAFNEGAVSQLRTQLDQVARDQISGLPALIGEKATPAIQEQIVKVRNLGKEFKTLIASAFRDWAINQKITTPNGDMLGVEVDGINLDIASWKITRDSGARLNRTTTDTIGASMSLQGQLWSSPAVTKESPISIRRYMFHHLSRFLSILGYQSVGNKIESGYLFPIEEQISFQPFFLEKGFSLKPLYVFPRVLRFSGTLDPQVQNKTEYNLRSQVSMLDGGSALIKVLKDYEKSSFDNLLGNVTLAEFKTDLIPEDQMSRKIFAKDNAFSLSVGVAASVLVNLSKSETPIFLVDSLGQRYWLKDIDIDNFPGTIVKVGIAGLDANQTVRSSDVSTLMTAIVGFLKATEDIKKTKASFLLDKDASGERLIDVLVKARKTLELLLLGMSNYLSSELVVKDKGVLKQTTASGVPDTAPEFLVSDQYLAAEALLNAGDYLNIKIYESNAKSILASLQQNFEKEIENLNFVKQVKHLSLLNRLKDIETNQDARAKLSEKVSNGLKIIEKRFIQ